RGAPGQADRARACRDRPGPRRASRAGDVRAAAGQPRDRDLCREPRGLSASCPAPCRSAPVRAGVITFPGSNCHRDAAVALAACGATVTSIWHGETELPRLDLIVLPGGFTYGDYLRCGAIAARSPVMAEVVRRAEAGVAVLGICNGFQILAEVGLV